MFTKVSIVFPDLEIIINKHFDGSFCFITFLIKENQIINKNKIFFICIYQKRIQTFRPKIDPPIPMITTVLNFL